MSQQGYYHYPDVRKNFIVFVSEDDIWRVPLRGGIARRLTANFSTVVKPKISPNGRHIVFTAYEEGHTELYLMDAKGGEPTRLTYFGAYLWPLGWTPDSKEILFVSNFNQAFESSIYKIGLKGGEPELVKVGYASDISNGEKGVVIGRHTRDAARWKRYRGGTAGEFWIDLEGNGDFKPFLKDISNKTNPMWIGDRIYFLSDHEGISNIYSVTPKGKDIKRHTDQREFFARNASTDGKNIVYQAGGDLFIYDIEADTETKLKIEYHSSRTQVQRKYVSASRYLQYFDLSKEGTHMVTVVRGKVQSFANWSGPVRRWGENWQARYRMPRWLNDGKRFVVVSDELDGEDRLLVVDTEKGKEKLLDKLNLGRIHGISTAPKGELIMVTNHRNEMIKVDVKAETADVLDCSDFVRIDLGSWSPDARWFSYSYFNTQQTALIRIIEVETGEIHDVSNPLRYDYDPAFSPDGRYLYFLGHREFIPIYDSVQFELSFMKSTKILCIPLQKETPSPFVPVPHGPGIPDTKSGKNGKNGKDKKDDELKVEIDFDGITERTVACPLAPGEYGILNVLDKKLIFEEAPRDGLPIDYSSNNDGKSRYMLKVYDLEKLQEDTILTGLDDYCISLDSKGMAVHMDGELIVLKPGDKPNTKAKNPYSVEGGKIDMNRIRTLISPYEEWHQMYREAWLLQREHFWTPNMSGVDWNLIYNRYLPLLERIGSRHEFSDIVWEMQGELGTSHCYEFGGDYRKVPRYYIGKLGCTYKLAPSGRYYLIDTIIRSGSNTANEASPLVQPGVNVEEGDQLLAINGMKVDRNRSPRECLLNLGGQEVTLTVRKPGERKTRDVVVKTMMNQNSLFYRAWVESNRRYVHEKSGGKVGYVHVPDMGTDGFSEFHRLFLTESRFDALLVDVRYNGGGHVSPLLLEKIKRTPNAWVATRWSKQPEAYPDCAVAGPKCALTNEYAGSDGDIFSHSFKMMGIGKLLGKRTWGGVVGINSQYSLADGAVTTQPEYSFWFKDVGWGVENYGTDPDIEIDIKPQDYVAGKDPQLDGAIEHLLDEMKKNPVFRPQLDKRPDLSLPKIPPRK